MSLVVWWNLEAGRGFRIYKLTHPIFSLNFFPAKRLGIRAAFESHLRSQKRGLKTISCSLVLRGDEQVSDDAI